MTIDPAALVVAVATLITAITGLVWALRGIRSEIKQVHQIVNSTSTEQVKRIDQLTQVITNAVPTVDLPPREEV